MSEQAPDYSLDSLPPERGVEKPELFLVKLFQTKEANYMKPPLAEQLLEPDGAPAGTASGLIVTSACTCNTVCVCVPVSTCACNTVCTCNTVSSTHGVTSSGSGSGSGTTWGGGGGGYGGYYAPCF